MILSSLRLQSIVGSCQTGAPFVASRHFPCYRGNLPLGGYGECGPCEGLRRLAGVLHSANPPRTGTLLMGSKIPARRLREVRNILSALSIENSAEFSMGTGECEGCVTIASMVTIFLIPGSPPKISSQPSPSSRRRLDTLQNHGPAGMGTNALVIDGVLIFQPPLIHI